MSFIRYKKFIENPSRQSGNCVWYREFKIGDIISGYRPRKTADKQWHFGIVVGFSPTQTIVLSENGIHKLKDDDIQTPTLVNNDRATIMNELKDSLTLFNLNFL